MYKQSITTNKAYVAPKIEVIYMHSEGMLAGSSTSNQSDKNPASIIIDSPNNTIGEGDPIYTRKLEQPKTDFWDE